jgi:nucleoside-diphosphate-sugar epimerase
VELNGPRGKAEGRRAKRVKARGGGAPRAIKKRRDTSASIADGPHVMLSGVLPERIETEEQLEECLSRPTTADIDCLDRLDGDVAIVGAGGKMGPSLTRRIKRASDEAGGGRRVLAISRWGSPAAREALDRDGIEAVACDLLDRRAVDNLPVCPYLLYLAGRKFGTTDRSDVTWAINTVVPASVAERYADARIVAFSTGNVYPMVPVASGGSRETDAPAPQGEYAQSCLGRERVIEYVSRERGTPAVIFRLNYAVDLRYGVPVDIARRVLSGEPVDVGVGHFNAIWQGDANSYALRSLELAASPPVCLNVTGPELVSVRKVARFFGERFGREPQFHGTEGPVAFLSNASFCHQHLGMPEVPLSQLLEWTAHWVAAGGASLNKPTHYEVSDGAY